MNFSGRTMLDLACFHGNSDCVESLLLQNVKVVAHDNVTGRTPLHAAGESVMFLLL